MWRGKASSFICLLSQIYLDITWDTMDRLWHVQLSMSVLGQFGVRWTGLLLMVVSSMETRSKPLLVCIDWAQYIVVLPWILLPFWICNHKYSRGCSWHVTISWYFYCPRKGFNGSPMAGHLLCGMLDVTLIKPTFKCRQLMLLVVALLYYLLLVAGSFGVLASINFDCGSEV